MSFAPKGTYKAYLAGMAYGFTANGKEQMEFVIDVHVSTTDIRRKSIMLSFEGGARQYTEDRLHMMGFNGDFEKPEVDPKWYSDGFEVYNTHEEYDDGKGQGPRSTEKWNFSRGFSTKPADGGAKAAAAQRWRAKYGSATAAPKPSSPPPASKGPPPAVEAPKPSGPPGEAPPSPWTKERAWQRYEDATGGKPDPTAWTKAVQAVLNGRRESQLTSDEWRGIAETLTDAEIPF